MRIPKLLLTAVALSFAISSSAFAQKEEPVAPHGVVKNLYAAHKAEKGPFFQTTDRSLVDTYFTKALGDLLWKDAVEANGEVGLLDFDPLFASQDPQITEFKITDATLGGEKKSGPETEAVVQVTFKDSGEARAISFLFLQGKDKTWKIDNIRYTTPDNMLLKDILSPK